MTAERWPALSLREPWLTAILDLGKRIENRRWNTSFRGRFWLHAAKAMTKREYQEGCDFIEHEVGLKPPPRSQLRAHGIAAAATLYHVLPRKWDFVGDAQGLNKDWKMDEQFGFVLVDVVKLPRVIPCVGRLGFFGIPPQVELAARAAMAEVV